jgi:hypothetical protein
MSRTVTGTIKHLDGTAWAAGIVKFVLVEGFETSTTVYPQYTHSETLDNSGQFTIDLATPDTGTAHYGVVFPDNSSYNIYVATGVSVDIVTLITVAGSAVTVSAVQTLLDAAEVFTIRSVSTTGDILATDEYVRASGTITLTLPAATGSGIAYAIKNVGSGVVTIEGSSSDTIDTAANATIEAGYDWVLIDVAAGAWDSIGGGYA